MNLTAHPVAPEEIMAWLDGELSTAEARTVAAHVDDCVECANLTAKFRSTTQALSSWTVPPVSSTLEEAIKDCAVKSAAKRKPARPASYTRFSFWNWKIWAIAGGGVIAGILVFVAIGVSLSYYSDHAPTKPSMLMVRPESAKDSRSGEEFSESRQAATLKSDRYVGAVAGISGTHSQAVQPQPSRASGIIAGGGGGGGYAPPVSAPAPMIARTASLTILVKDIASARSSLDAIVAQHRGYSAEITVDLSESAPPRGIVASLRVPAPDLPSALADLRAIGRVQREKQSGEEVTQQHADLVARLQNSRETEQRLRDILTQRTGKIEDVLQVEEEIARVRGEIESMEADQKTLEHRVDFATVDLELVEDYKVQFNPPTPSASIRMHNAFVAGFHHVADTLLGIILFFEEFGPVLLIWLAILGVPPFFVWRRYRKVRGLF
jgi:anti-sigma factor RsiW